MGTHRFREALVRLAQQPRELAKSLGRLIPGAAAQGLTLISLDGQWLKLLQVEGLGPARRITKLFACPVEGKTAEEVTTAFQAMCATEGVAPRDVLVANPSHLSTVRLFALPSTDVREIRDIVDLQAEKHTPYAKDEVLIDFSVLERDRSGYSRVLLVIAHQDVIHRPVRLIETSGWTLDHVGCELEGLVGWSRLLKRRPSASSAPGASMVLDVDSRTTTILIMHQDQPQFYRNIAMGAEQLQGDLGQWGAKLVGEIQRSVESDESEGWAGKLQEVFLTGRCTRLPDLTPLLEDALKVPVSRVEPWGAQALPEHLRSAVERLPEVSFAGLVGLALATSDINLTPQGTKLRHAFEARAKALVVLACQGIGALVLASLLIIGQAQKSQRYYAMLSRVYRQSEVEAVSVQEALQQLEFIKRRFQRRGELLGAVETLARLSPEGIRWTTLTYLADQGLTLKGTSEVLPKVYEFVASLDGTHLLGRVEPKRVAKRKSGDADVTDFEINCPLGHPGAAP